MQGSESDQHLPDESGCVAVSVYVLRRHTSKPQLLFLRRSGGRFEGQWWPVTGTREPSEDPIQCALRELREETSLTPYALFRTGLTAPVEGGGYLRIFVASVDAAEIVRANWEHDAYRWCSVEEAHSIIPGFPDIVREAVRVFETQPAEQAVPLAGRQSDPAGDRPA